MPKRIIASKINYKNQTRSDKTSIKINSSKKPEVNLILRSGIFKNIKLKAPPSIFTRPSKAILRDGVFDYLQNELEDVSFFEAFAGSGQVGFLALSRGAKRTVFVEQNRSVFEILEKNIAFISSKFDLKNRIFAFCDDTLKNLQVILEKFENEKFILFLDPPFPAFDGDKIYENCLKTLQFCNLANCKYVIFEAKTSFDFPLKIQNLSMIRKRAFGKSSLIVYQKVENG